MSTLGAIVVAAGSSSRMNGIDKVWAQLAGKPALWHSVVALGAVARQVSVVVRPQDTERAEELLRSALTVPWIVVPGGSRRQDSVRNGLEHMRDVDAVAVHDGARPFIPRGSVRRVWQASATTGAAILALPVADTLKRVHQGEIVGGVDRSELWAAQTPQVFSRELLREAHAQAETHAWTMTDDAGLIEAIGGRVLVVPGSPWNIKITTPDDLHALEVFMRFVAQKTVRLPEVVS